MPVAVRGEIVGCKLAKLKVSNAVREWSVKISVLVSAMSIIVSVNGRISYTVRTPNEYFLKLKRELVTSFKVACGVLP